LFNIQQRVMRTKGYTYYFLTDSALLVVSFFNILYVLLRRK